MATNKINKLWTFTLSMLCICVLIYGISMIIGYFISIVAYVLIALVVSILGRPVVDFLGRFRYKRFHLPPGPCALITLLLFYFIIILFISKFLPLISNQAAVISNIDPGTISQSVHEEFGNIDSRLRDYHIFTTPEESSLNSIIHGASNAVNIANLSDIFNSIIG